MGAHPWTGSRLARLASGIVLATATALSAAPVDELGWLAGTWSFERNGRTVTEHWLPPAGGTMLGVSRTTAGERTLEYEFIVLRSDESGQVLYVAKPSGQVETVFTLKRVSASEAVFENPGHDFPQRIIYSLLPDGGLLAAIEGIRDGGLRRVEFPYRRVGPEAP